ncbi:hypothetical protein HU200_003388 [Digitaria exilis]|uniref:Uncharacterized protein n=1 Tax=Digitaria exilis TaxID=1010633 RepID=A0A835KUT2_9POAL|nr:hypothetical protein HU200_003388 [Digitaria exilis]
MSNDVSPVYLTFTVNAQKRVGPMEGYYGNCITTQPIAAATSGVVAEASVVELVRMIKRAKSQLHEKAITMGNDGRCDDEQLLRGLRRRYDMMNVTSWRNIGFERVDLGSGTPARVMSHTRHGGAPRVPACVMYPPCKGKDGVNLLSLAVMKEHAGAFLGELAKLEHAVI